MSNLPKIDFFISAIQNINNQQLEALRGLAAFIQREIEFIENIHNSSLKQLTESGFSLDEILASFEKEIICITLNRTAGVQSKAAQILGINTQTLHAKIKRYQIDMDKF